MYLITLDRECCDECTIAVVLRNVRTFGHTGFFRSKGIIRSVLPPPPHANLKQLLSSFKLPYLAIQHHAHLKKKHLRYNYMSHNTEYELRKVHVFCLSEFCLFKEYRLVFF